MTIDECEKPLKDKGALPEYIYIDFWSERTPGNKVLFGVYRLLKCLYTSIWFYFFPYATIICSYTIPLLYLN